MRRDQLAGIHMLPGRTHQTSLRERCPSPFSIHYHSYYLLLISYYLLLISYYLLLISYYLSYH